MPFIVDLKLLEQFSRTRMGWYYAYCVQKSKLYTGGVEMKWVQNPNAEGGKLIIISWNFVRLQYLEPLPVP